IPGCLPQVTIRIHEVACISAPEGLSSRLDYAGASLTRLLHHRVDLFTRIDVVAEAELGGRRGTLGKAGVVREIPSLPQGELQTSRKVEERDCAMLVLLAYDALRGKAQAVTVEFHGALEVVHAEGEHGNTRLHADLRCP